MIKPNRVFKKRDTWKGANREQHSRTRTKKKNVEQKHENKTKKRKSKKEGQTCKKQINMKRCPTKREMNKQVFFDLEKCVSKKDIKR